MNDTERTVAQTAAGEADSVTVAAREAVRPAVGTSQAVQELPAEYAYIRQGPATNDLTKGRTDERAITVNPITEAATVQRGKCTVSIAGYNELVEQLGGVKWLRTSTFQTLDFLTLTLTASGCKSPEVVFTLTDYMTCRGLKDRKEAKKQLSADLQLLRRTALTYEETYTQKRGRAGDPIREINVADMWEWLDTSRTRARFVFGNTLYTALKAYNVMPYPNQLLQINAKRNPNSYALGRKIAELKNMNLEKPNECIVAVRTLLDNAPAIPGKEEVLATNRDIKGRIIDPLERDLDLFAPSLFCWEYCKAHGEELTDEELATMTWEQFLDLNIKIFWNGYPEQEERRKRIQDKRARARKARAQTKPKPRKKTAEADTTAEEPNPRGG